MRNDVNTCVQDVALLQGSPQSAVEPVLEIEVAPPLHNVSEQVPEKGRVFVQERCEVEGALGRDQLVEPDLVGWQLRPVPHLEAVIRVRPHVTDTFEDHMLSVERAAATPPGPAQLPTGVVPKIRVWRSMS